MTLAILHATQIFGSLTPCAARVSGPAFREAPIIADGAVVIRDGRIDWIGPTADLPPLAPDCEIIDAASQVVLPGFVDSHTHLLFAGSRENEFEDRLRGRSYQEIAEQGGGINATVHRVRAASKEELKALARPRLHRLLEHGVTTVEVKSGYGLTLADEIKCLEAIADLSAEGPLELVATFLVLMPFLPSTKATEMAICVCSSTTCCRRSPAAGWRSFAMSSVKRGFSRSRNRGGSWCGRVTWGCGSSCMPTS